MNGQYHFMLGEVEFPMILQTIEANHRSNNKVIHTLDGPINQIGGPALAELKVQGLLCWNLLPNARKDTTFEKPTYYIDLLNEFIQKKMPVSLSSWNHKGERPLSFFKIYYVTVEDFTCDESASNGSDFEITIFLKEYVVPITKRIVTICGEQYFVNEIPDYVTEAERLRFEQQERDFQNRLIAYPLSKGGMIVMVYGQPYYFSISEKYKWKGLVLEKNNSLFYKGEIE